ncbi:MAG: sulfatase/phosphatase domain-containing protein [Methyloceanibacter sp.]
MRGPGIPANATREQLVNNLDVVATILDVAGAAPGVVPVGRSLSPLFADANAPWRSTLLIQSPVNRYAPTRHRYRGVRTTRGSTSNMTAAFEELLDLSADPHELNNEARNASYASDLVALRSLQDTLKACAGTSCWVP